MLRILYLGNSPDYSLPSDRRRTFGFLKRFKKKYKLYNHFEKGVKYDILICTIGTDLNKVLSVLPSVKKFVLDYSDNYLIEKSFFKNYFRLPFKSIINKSKFCFKTYQTTIVDLIKHADLIIYPSIDYKKLLEPYNKKIFKISDFLESEVPDCQPNFNTNSLFWEGLSCNITSLKSVCNNLDMINSPRLNVVTDPYFGPFSGRFLKCNSKKKLESYYQNIKFYNWSHINLISAVGRSRLGIIPLDKSDLFMFTKPENKLVFMWFMGLPAITSKTNSYCMLENQIGFNFTVNNYDWNPYIDKFINSENNYIELSQHIRNFAINNYSDSKIKKRWLNAFEEFTII